MARRSGSDANQKTHKAALARLLEQNLPQKSSGGASMIDDALITKAIKELRE